MSGPADFALAVPVRWISLVALAGLVGGLAVRVIVLPPDVPALEQALARWTRVCTLLLLVAGAAELLLRARTMAGGDLGSGLAAVPTVLTRTHFGGVWIARGAALLAVLALVGHRTRAAWITALGAGLAVACTTALAGHAADRGDVSLRTLIDWLHVVAATVWTGGLFCLVVVVLRRARRWPPPRLVLALRRFSTLAGVCLVAVVASGVFNAWTQLGALDALWASTYGRILIVKVLLVLAVASLGAATRFRLLPVLRADAGSSRNAVNRLGRYVACEAGLALLVFGCTALLTDSTPPHHEAEMGPSSHAAGRLHGSVARPQAVESSFASLTKRAHESAHALHTACVSACLRHSFSQSSQTARQAVANSPTRAAPSVASSATAEQAGIISDTFCAHAASDVSPLLNMARQCARHAWPVELHSRAASMRA
jgi:putative copper export protein